MFKEILSAGFRCVETSESKTREKSPICHSSYGTLQYEVSNFQSLIYNLTLNVFYLISNKYNYI